MLNQSLVGRRRGGGFFGEMIRWFIQIAIYQICIGTIASIFGVSHFVATFIFLVLGPGLRGSKHERKIALAHVSDKKNRLPRHSCSVQSPRSAAQVEPK